eukprot:m.228937 g.228937  ORF g.228937 m.228937 type:complete len:136 (-) comp19250_c1_seq55:2253-2660(-)
MEWLVPSQSFSLDAFLHPCCVRQSPDLLVYTLLVELHGSSTLPSVSDIAGVSEWQGRLFESDATDAQSAGNASPVQRCLNVVLLPCVTDLRSSDAVDYQRWRVGPPPDYADDAAVLDGDPHPRPHDMRLRGVSLQ